MTATAVTQAEKGRAFRALHEREGAFIIPNPWDVGTARLLAHRAAKFDPEEAFALMARHGVRNHDQRRLRLFGGAVRPDGGPRGELGVCLRNRVRHQLAGERRPRKRLWRLA
jgi:hypothetical protein